MIDLWNSIIELLIAPKLYPEMIWMIIPLVIVTIVMTFYFGMYKREQLGWNTAVGNSLVLIFVSIDLLRHIFNLSSPGSVFNYTEVPFKSVVAGLIFLEGLLLMFINMMHFLPKKISFAISSPLPVNLTAYLVMTIVYTEMVFDFATLCAAAIIFIGFYGILKFVQLAERALIKKIALAKVAEEKKEIDTSKKELEKEKAQLALKEKMIKKEEELEKLEEKGTKKAIGKKGSATPKKKKSKRKITVKVKKRGKKKK